MLGITPCGSLARTTPASPRRWWSSANLQPKGLNRRDLGREKFEERVWQWKCQSGGHDQEANDPPGRKLRLVPRTLHPRRGPVPRRARDLRPPVRKRPHLSRRVHGQLVPRCQTAISDLETIHEETQGHLWHIAYPVIGTDRQADRSHNPSRDDARRHRRRDQSRGRALFRPARQESSSAFDESRDPDHSRRRWPTPSSGPASSKSLPRTIRTTSKQAAVTSFRSSG